MVGVEQNTPHHKYDVAKHTLYALKNIKRDKILRLTMLFHDMGSRLSEQRMRMAGIISKDMRW